ncbi:MAG TPA: hypothetical protein P5060_03750 [Candidatus Absconditabacterales bacterium]|nr:hypothetical protein [Candidatus Absconditabacterales bacterium]
MKIISKTIAWILSIVLAFVAINLLIGVFKYKGIQSYAQYLDQKDWNQTISDLNIKNIPSILHIFYDKNIVLSEETQNSNNTGDNQQLTGDTDSNTGIQAYDPAFEDEFNSFFGGDSEIEVVDEEIEDSAVSDTETGDLHPIAEQLIQKFNE